MTIEDLQTELDNLDNFSYDDSLATKAKGWLSKCVIFCNVNKVEPIYILNSITFSNHTVAVRADLMHLKHLSKRGLIYDDDGIAKYLNKEIPDNDNDIQSSKYPLNFFEAMQIVLDGGLVVQENSMSGVYYTLYNGYVNMAMYNEQIYTHRVEMHVTNKHRKFRQIYDTKEANIK